MDGAPGIWGWGIQGFAVCGEWRDFREAEEIIPQGLKPFCFVGFIGTTEVVPFQSFGVVGVSSM